MAKVTAVTVKLDDGTTRQIDPNVSDAVFWGSGIDKYVRPDMQARFGASMTGAALDPTPPPVLWHDCNCQYTWV